MARLNPSLPIPAQSGCLATPMPGFSTPPGTPAVRPRETNWIQWTIIFQILCQLILLTGLVDGNWGWAIRILARTSAFGISLLALVFLPGNGKCHPSAKPALVVMALLVIALFHSDTNSMIAGLAEITLYLAILAPLFWVQRLPAGGRTMRRVLLTLWLFHTLSSCVAILQVYYPGRFQPNVSAVITSRPAYYKSLTIIGRGGKRMLRPMGLTDLPGGAGMSGFYSVLLGSGLLLAERRSAKRFIFLASVLAGMMALYFSQVRALLVVLCVCMAVFIATLAWKGMRTQLTFLISTLAILGALSFTAAGAIGGRVILERVRGLFANPSKAYSKSRGAFLTSTVNDLLPRYPLGAGLARSGMMYSYFGDKSKSSLWAEIQWTEWLYDGGVPLILAYSAMLALALRTALTVALRPAHGDLWLWGTVVLAYDFGAIACTFDSPFFMSQSGMELWILNALLFTVASSQSTTGPVLKQVTLPHPAALEVAGT